MVRLLELLRVFGVRDVLSARRRRPRVDLLRQRGSAGRIPMDALMDAQPPSATPRSAMPTEGRPRRRIWVAPPRGRRSPTRRMIDVAVTGVNAKIATVADKGYVRLVTSAFANSTAGDRRTCRTGARSAGPVLPSHPFGANAAAAPAASVATAKRVSASPIEVLLSCPWWPQVHSVHFYRTRPWCRGSS